MKKSLLYIAAATVLFAGCGKEADQKVDEKTGKVYTITAVVENNETRTYANYDADVDKYHFEWLVGEEIAVLPAENVDNPLPFTYENSDTFTYTATSGEPEYTSFNLAVSPYNAIIAGSYYNNYSLVLSGNYTQGESNAVMVAGTPSGTDGHYKFTFKHAAALVHITYNEIPEDAVALVFNTPDQAIIGDWAFDANSSTPITMAAYEEVTTANSTVRVSYDPDLSITDFYIPIPTGDYQTFNVKLVKLVNGEEVTIDGSEKSFHASSSFSVERADVIVCPEITITTPPEDLYYEKVTSNDDLKSGQYLIVHENSSVAFNGGLTTLDANSNKIGVTITDDGILSNTETDAASFTIVINGDNNSKSTIKSASGYFIGRDANSNGLNSNQTTVYYSTISINQDGEAEIVGPGGARLRYNSATNNWRFRYFSSSTYTNQQPIALYRLSATAPVTEKELNSALSISGNIKKQFNVNETFSFGDGVVKATYSNGEFKVLSVSDVEVSGFDSSDPTDSQQITLTYRENGHSATGTYTISIVGSITGAKYKKVNTLTSGKKYLIAAGNGDGYIMPHPVSSGTQSGVSVTINNGEIESTESTDACAFTITRKQVNSQWYYVISYTVSGTTHYVAASSATNTKITNTTTVPSNVNQNSLWNITTPSTNFGTFNIQDAGQTDRSILWRPLDGTTPFNKFGHYQGTGNSTYYNVDLYEYTAATTE